MKICETGWCDLAQNELTQLSAGWRKFVDALHPSGSEGNK